MALLLTIAMPVYNEEACVEVAVGEALGVLDDLEGEGEVLVIDDGSNDATPQILSKLTKQDGRLSVVRHDVNQGIGGFNRSMMEKARGEWVLFVSSDGEFDPNEAVRFIGLAQVQNADAVCGYRTSKNYNLWRKLVSSSFNAFTFLCFGATFRDIGSIRMLRRSFFQPIRLYSHSAFINAERLLVGRRQGAKIIQVPTNHRPRLSGQGGGAKVVRVLAAMGDLYRTRLRWFRFDAYYQ